ncbi:MULTISPECIES: phosphoribosylaminoimidazolesuccinocarboxamide synthase [unclassified Haladaptatus]|uniref:phosphoribosylaminoimidazolesuccinocarboxamide synthase n=1 Tax=unclassified Haladaptatus TaxID=2622732 RepID=UPI00209C2CAC|nr:MULTISPECIES: phosphoribosylaminoimidazolesuccinocarboxamide synthase [unclassified Haladaptatus]MCO8243138.1 phosphoribosylaminoimidazolesuccinocarboxamide synthase [Haladaptatus sp. AB643]MCO8252850.1 phosphoribosylaminoimidazolesuccinocarboxamide synthase [Haladaptatus sp. AB618]
MTSVKEFRVEEEPTPDSLGRGSFVFTNDYSVFDWGKMPDTIPDKGASLCTMGAFNFERLEEEGIPTHYRGVVSDGNVVSLSDVTEPPTEMAIDLTQVPNLPHEGRDYDYELFHSGANDNYLIPLEVVFRNSVPVGSSLRRRTDPADHGLDFPEWPDGAVQLEEPVIEFSTKFEKGDRYLSRSEADEIAGKADISELERVAREVNDLVTRQAAKSNLTHEDGKIECLYYDGEIRVADVVGTFDENRFTFHGQQVSKEFIRQYHKREQPAWVDAVKDAKVEAKERDIADWKSLCSEDPQPLPDELLTAARDLYTAGTNAYVSRDFFDAPSLEDAVMAVKEL